MSCNKMELDRWMDGWMDGRTDGRTDGWTDGWMDHSVQIAIAIKCYTVQNFKKSEAPINKFII